MTPSGGLAAVPFPSAARPPPADKHASAAAFGRINRSLNPPDRDRLPLSRASYSAVARTPQSAGAPGKLPTPYAPGALRSRLPVAFKRDPPPFASTLSFHAGLVNADAHAWRTVSGAAQAAAVAPRHVGVLSNPGIQSEVNKRLAARVLG